MIGCLLAPLKGIWTFLRWSFTSGWKGFVVLGVIVIIVVVAAVVIKGKVTDVVNPTPVTATQIGVPSEKDAPYIVQTSSRYYFAREVETKDDVTTMTGYWQLVDNTWKFSDRTLVLTKEYGTIKVGKR